MTEAEEMSDPEQLVKPAWVEAMMATLLAAVAGWVDAVGYLHFGGLFLSFMSGNTTKLGVDIGHADVSMVLLPALVIGCFVFGALFGTLLDSIARTFGGALVLGIVTLLLLAVLVFHRGYGIEALSIGLLAAAMGIKNTAMQGVAGHAVGLTYLTGNLTKLGKNLAHLIMGQAVGRKCLLFAGMWAAMLCGAISGTLVYARAEIEALWPMALLLGGVALLRCAHAWRRR